MGQGVVDKAGLSSGLRASLLKGMCGRYRRDGGFTLGEYVKLWLSLETNREVF